jgi:branched-chain amino acid transport system permease protein
MVFAVAIAIAFIALKAHYLLSALVLGGIYAIVILGLVLLTGLSGQYSLGHAAFFGLGAYASALLSQAGLMPALAGVVAVLLTTAIAALISIPLVHLRGYYLAVATLAYGLIVASMLNGWRSLTQGPSGLGEIPPLGIGPFVFRGDSANYWLAWGIAFLCMWGALNLWRSRMGQAMLAVKRDEISAAALGISVARIKVQIFAVSAALAALGGTLYAHYVSFIAPERFGMVPSFELLLAALLGGVGTPYGAIVGALLLIALPEIVAPLRDYKVIVYGVTFILVSLYFPHGIAGVLQHALGRRASGSRPQAQQSTHR